MVALTSSFRVTSASHILLREASLLVLLRSYISTACPDPDPVHGQNQDGATGLVRNDDEYNTGAAINLEQIAITDKRGRDGCGTDGWDAVCVGKPGTVLARVVFIQDNGANGRKKTVQAGS